MGVNQFHILINAQAGTASKLGRDKIEDLIGKSSLNGADFHFLETEAFNKKMLELMDSSLPVLVGGGDGTILKSAALHLERNKPFGVLPFGTMNLLAQDLHVPLDFAESLEAYQATKTVAIDVGVVNGHYFLCCASWGTMPEAARFREENRALPDVLLMPRMTSYVFNQMNLTRKRRLKMVMDGKPLYLRTSMLVISNNIYQPNTEGQPFNKDSLQDGVFGVYTVSPKGAFEKIRVFLNLKTGAWRSDPAITEYRARAVTVETKRRRELISVDGEPVEMNGPFEFKLLPQALRLIVPAASAIKKEAA